MNPENTENFLDRFEYIASLIGSMSWMDLLWNARMIFLVLSIPLFILFVILFFKSYPFRPKFSKPFLSVPIKQAKWEKDAEIKKRWTRVIEKAYSAPPHSLILAIVEADKLVDDAIKRMGVQGETMAERLDKVGMMDIRSINRLWRAHKIRNELVHESDFEISKEEAKEVLRIYEEFLKEIDKI